jgi:hypothetical protein
MHKVEFALSFSSFYFFPLLPFGNSSPKSWEELMGVPPCKKDGNNKWEEGQKYFLDFLNNL